MLSYCHHVKGGYVADTTTTRGSVGTHIRAQPDGLLPNCSRGLDDPKEAKVLRNTVRIYENNDVYFDYSVF